MAERSREEGEPGPRQVQVSRTTARVPEEVGVGVFATGAIVLAGAHEFLVDFVQRIAPPPRIVARVILPLPVVPALIQALKTNIGLYEQRFGPIVVPRRGEAMSGTGPEKPRSAQEAGPAVEVPVVPGPSAERAPGASRSGAASSGSEASRGDEDVESRPADEVPIEPGTPPVPPTIEEIYADLKFPEDLQTGRYANEAVVRHELGAFGLDFVVTVYPRPLVTARVLLPAVAGPDLLGSLVRSWEPLRRRPQ